MNYTTKSFIKLNLNILIYVNTNTSLFIYIIEIKYEKGFMMRYLLYVILFCSFSFAKYNIIYNDITLGEINHLDTIKKEYLEISITNKLAKFIFAKDKFIIYNENYTGNLEEENTTKFKKDKYQIIKILNLATLQNIVYKKIIIEKDKYIEIVFNKDYSFKYVSKNKIKSEGYIEVQNNILISLIDTKNNIKILKL